MTFDYCLRKLSKTQTYKIIEILQSTKIIIFIEFSKISPIFFVKGQRLRCALCDHLQSCNCCKLLYKLGMFVDPLILRKASFLLEK